MSKKLNEWLDEFVENGADASDVTEWPENTGGSGTDISPFIMVKANEKVVVDFSQYNYGYGTDGYYNPLVDGYVSTDDYSAGQFGVFLTVNEEHTQLIATLVYDWGYQHISNEVVIYEG